MLRKVPLIVILGSTGTGKTKLSIELAKKFGGEIISADSMQVYANLDIVTAKATKEEQSSVKHHLLDVVKPGGDPYTVFSFRNDSLPIIEDLLGKTKPPIVVGGTNYYIESLLWDMLVPNFEKSNSDSEEDTNSNCEEIKKLSNDEMESMSSEILHDHLKIVDPTSANRIHPRNRRKVIRALEVFNQLDGKRNLSDIYKEQRSQPGGCNLGGPLRYSHIVLFWLRCNKEVLSKRLDKRVDDMLKQGLLKEVRDFYNANIKDAKSSQYTKGILQSIGFKEFVPYLESFDSNQDKVIESYLKENSYEIIDRKDNPEGLNVLKGCLDQLKLVTNRYSRKQIKWINNRLLASSSREVPDIFELDSSDVSNWNENVHKKAVSILNSYINDKKIEFSPMSKIQHKGEGLNEEISNYCKVCERLFIGEFQWQIHLKSNKHKKRKEGLKRKKNELSEEHIRKKNSRETLETQ
ncbi:TRIT1 family protein [Megaselia abdita]